MTRLQFCLPLEAQKVAPALPARINTMLIMYGQTSGQKCGTCVHLYGKRMGGTYYKCKLSKVTSGPGTDWRLRWPACGKWERRT